MQPARLPAPQCLRQQQAIATEIQGASSLITRYHPWTNASIKRMNRIIKEAAITFHYPDLENSKAHVLGNARAFNFAKHFIPDGKRIIQSFE